MERPSSLLNWNRSDVLIIYKASGDGPFLASPGSVTKQPLQDFPGTALRQLGFGELDAARNFEIGERSSAMCDQLISSKSFPRLENNAGFHDLTPLRVGYSDDCQFAHRWMLLNDSPDFAG